MKFLHKLTILIAAILCSVSLSVGSAAAYDPFASACSKAPNSPTCQQANSQDGTKNPLTNLISEIANVIAVVAGIAAVIVIILAGFTFVTSGGNAEAVAGARRRIMYAIVGLVVVALAWTITRFITDTLIK